MSIDPPSVPQIRVPGYEGPDRRQGDIVVVEGIRHLVEKVAEVAQWAQSHHADQDRWHNDLERRIADLSVVVQATSSALEKRLSDRHAVVLNEMRQLYLDARGSFRVAKWLVAVVTSILALLAAVWALFGR